MSIIEEFGLSPKDKQTLDKANEAIDSFVRDCTMHGIKATMLGPALIAEGCDLIETATGSHAAALNALKAIVFIFQQAEKITPPDAGDSIKS